MKSNILPNSIKKPKGAQKQRFFELMEALEALGEKDSLNAYPAYNEFKNKYYPKTNNDSIENIAANDKGTNSEDPTFEALPEVAQRLEILMGMDYVSELELTEADIVPLATIVTSDKLYHHKDVDKFFATLHAAKALGQMQALEAIPVLVNQLYKCRAFDDDWLGESYPVILACMGESAIASLRQAIKKTTDEQVQVLLNEALTYMVDIFPETKPAVTSYLVETLTNHKDNSPYFNAFVVISMVDLGMTDQLPIIREAYAADNVDLSMMGDIEEVEIEMGVRETRDTPKPNFNAGLLEKLGIDEDALTILRRQMLKEKPTSEAVSLAMLNTIDD